MPLDELPELLTTAEVAALTGRRIGTVNRWARDGLLPVAKHLPGRTGANLYRRTDVDALLRDKAAA